MGMGAFAAVAQGGAEEPRADRPALRPAAARGPPLGLVGKAVTFDTGGISIKPAAGMADMKFDMSGGAAVLEATAAIAAARAAGRPDRGRRRDREHARRAPRSSPATSSRAMQRHDGRGQQHRRRGPADPRRRACLRARARRRADRRPRDADRRRRRSRSARSTPAAVSNDDELGGRRSTAAGDAPASSVWRLPLHDEYAKLIKAGTPT